MVVVEATHLKERRPWESMASIFRLSRRLGWTWPSRSFKFTGSTARAVWFSTRQSSGRRLATQIVRLPELQVELRRLSAAGQLQPEAAELRLFTLPDRRDHLRQEGGGDLRM
jgi:hypothetical protein